MNPRVTCLPRRGVPGWMGKLSSAIVGLAVLLLANGVSVHQQPNVTQKKSSFCTCLTWKYAYDPGTYKAKCGKGWELFEWHERFKNWGKVTHKWYNEICKPWFEQLDANFCMKYEPKQGAKEWCYVDKRCPGAAGVSGRPVGIKNCSEADGDELFSKKTPSQVNWLAKTYRMPTAAISRYAYNMAPVKFEEIRDYWERKWPLANSRRQEVEDYKNSGETWMFEGDKTYPNISLVRGQELWIMEPRPETRTGFEYVCRRSCGGHMST